MTQDSSVAGLSEQKQPESTSSQFHAAAPINTCAPVLVSVPYVTQTCICSKQNAMYTLKNVQLLQ